MPSAPQTATDMHKAAQPTAAPTPVLVPSAVPGSHGLEPNFVLPFCQAPSAPMPDPAVQVLMLQQMAAILSMQAAMLKAIPPAQLPPSVQPSLQSQGMLKELHQPRTVQELHNLEMSMSTRKELQKGFSQFVDEKLPADFSDNTLPMFSYPFSFDDKLELGKKNFQDTSVPQGVTGMKVKNTFIDFQPEQPKGMRAVQTCLGGFSFMTGQDDDEE